MHGKDQAYHYDKNYQVCDHLHSQHPHFHHCTTFIHYTTINNSEDYIHLYYIMDHDENEHI